MFRTRMTMVVDLLSRAGITALVTLLPLLAPRVARAQVAATTTAIAGVVLDPDAKVVVGAVVLARNELSGELRTTTTDARGHFSVGVSAGTYTVEVAVPGFEIVRWSGLHTAAASSPVCPKGERRSPRRPRQTPATS